MIRLHNQQSITCGEAWLRRAFLRWRFGIEDRFSFVYQLVVASLSTSLSWALWVGNISGCRSISCFEQRFWVIISPQFGRESSKILVTVPL